MYEAFVEGAKDGFQVAIRIIPYLVAILVAVGMFRSSGALGYVSIIGPFTTLFVPRALPMALLRPRIRSLRRSRVDHPRPSIGPIPMPATL